MTATKDDSADLIAAAQKNLAMLGTSATAQEIELFSTLALAQATVALALEQRTANLIAFYGYGDIIELETITERLGL